MIIDYLPVWLFFLIMVGLVFFSVEIGFRLGRKVRSSTEDERESPASSIAGVILGLQAFMLAFTFGIVSDRYEIKKVLVRDEANVIRTTWNRAEFLSEPDRTRSKTLLLDYVALRLKVAESGDIDFARASLGEFVRIQQQLWAMAVANARIDMNSDIGAMYVDSVNELTALHATRVGIGLDARIPTAVWVTLVSLLILGMVALGYHIAIADSSRSKVTSVLAVAFSLVIGLIAALDHPGNRLMPVSQQALVTVHSEMKAESAN